MKDFQNKISIYEMAQMDALRSSLMTLGQLIDEKEDKEIEFPKKVVLLKDVDVDEFEPYFIAKSICRMDNNDIVIVNVDEEYLPLEKISANDIIEIASKIVMQYV